MNRVFYKANNKTSVGCTVCIGYLPLGRLNDLAASWRERQAERHKHKRRGGRQANTGKGGGVQPPQDRPSRTSFVCAFQTHYKSLFHDVTTLWLRYGLVGEGILWFGLKRLLCKRSSRISVAMVTIINTWLRLGEDCGHASKKRFVDLRLKNWKQIAVSHAEVQYCVDQSSHRDLSRAGLCHFILTSLDFLLFSHHNYCGH